VNLRGEAYNFAIFTLICIQYITRPTTLVWCEKYNLAMKPPISSQHRFYQAFTSLSTDRRRDKCLNKYEDKMC